MIIHASLAWRKIVVASAATMLTAIVGMLPVAALADGPTAMYVPSGSCTRAYCETYAKSAQLPSGKLIASFEDNNQPAVGQTFPIFASSDNGRTWSKTGTVPDLSPRNWGNWTNPFFYVLPQPIGNMPAGTLLLAGITSPPDRSATAIEIYRSNDEGASWSWVSEVGFGGGEWGSANPTPIWEPYLLVANNKLITYYSDERDKAKHSQKLVHQTSTDGVNWGALVEDVALADASLRPGMAVVSRMSNGNYILTYEMIGLSGPPNNFKISADPESWNPTNAGTTIDHGGNPYLITLPNGRLAYNSGGSSDILVNTNNGAGAWIATKTTMPAGYSRQLQYVAATGRVEILSVDGFWTTTPNTVYYGDVDLGYSAGAYYQLVNRKSGKLLDVYQNSLQDGATAVQWPADGGANQLWHLRDIGSGYRTLISKQSGRALSIWATGKANGDNAVQWVENGKNDQAWTLVPVGSYYKLVNRNSGLVLSVQGGSTNDGAQVVQWADNGGLDQQWQLVQVP